MPGRIILKISATEMTVQTVLKEAQSKLFYAEVETPMLDAVVLLSAALDLTKEKTLASLPETVDREGYTRYQQFLDRRCAGSPVSYICRKKEFFSLEFYVDERVLVPRPDTEILVEEALQILQSKPFEQKVHDACTGSGCIAIAIKHNRPEAEVTASDISLLCGEVYRKNAQKLLGFSLPFCRSDLLRDVQGRYNLITANPPYITDKEVENMQKIGWPEPELALKGGNDGTLLLEGLILQAPEKLCRGGTLLLESAAAQVPRLIPLLQAAGFGGIRVLKDLAGRDRGIRAEI